MALVVDDLPIRLGSSSAAALIINRRPPHARPTQARLSLCMLVSMVAKWALSSGRPVARDKVCVSACHYLSLLSIRLGSLVLGGDNFHTTTIGKRALSGAPSKSLFSLGARDRGANFSSLGGPKSPKIGRQTLARRLQMKSSKGQKAWRQMKLDGNFMNAPFSVESLQIPGICEASKLDQIETESIDRRPLSVLP